jgi:hypothetical protein
MQGKHIYVKCRRKCSCTCNCSGHDFLKRKIVVLIYFWFLDVPDERWWEGC